MQNNKREFSIALILVALIASQFDVHLTPVLTPKVNFKLGALFCPSAALVDEASNRATLNEDH